MSGCDLACHIRCDPCRAPFGDHGPVVLQGRADEKVAELAVAGIGVGPVPVPAWPEDPRHLHHLGMTGLVRLLAPQDRHGVLHWLLVHHRGPLGHCGTVSAAKTYH